LATVTLRSNKKSAVGDTPLYNDGGACRREMGAKKGKL